MNRSQVPPPSFCPSLHVLRAQQHHGITIDDVLIHDEKAGEPTLAFLLSRLIGPHFPECLGVFRCVQRPTFEQLLDESFLLGSPPRGLEALLKGDESWAVA